MAGQDEVGAIASLVMAGASTVFTSRILSLSITQSIPDIDMTALDQATGNGRVMVAGKLKGYSMSGTMIWDASANPTIGGAKKTTTLTMADATGTTFTWATANSGGGFLVNVDPTINLEERMEAAFTLSLSGVPS